MQALDESLSSADHETGKNLLSSLSSLCAAIANAQTPTPKEVESVYPDAHALYLDLHQNPELSGHETQTAAKLAARLRSAGYEVTEHVGGTGVVAILKNGAGTDDHAAHRT